MKIAVHYAEIGLKGRNRPRFEARLCENLERALRPLVPPRIRKLFGRLLVELPPDTPFEAAATRIGRVFGVAYFSRASVCKPTLEAIESMVDGFIKEQSFESFGVRVRRSEKSHPFTSSELAVRLGTRIQKRSGARVDLSQPELWVELHVLSREALLLHEKIPGPGGMPVGTAGRIIGLISGGIDSPVAAFRMLKRGCTLSYVHFHSSPFTSAASQDKVRELVARLAVYQGPVKLHLVPFGELQERLVRGAPASPRIVLYRRLMLRIAEAIARREGALALTTGESLGQVSSQTLANLDTINRAATLPVFRPLIGLDKSEIIELAQRIGTYEISIELDEDCCSYLMPSHPATWTRPEPVEAIESELDIAGMVHAALERSSCERIDPSDE
ncbi:MAG: tRNA uracil 4-sulfurtransferase ThiI [Myxococcota bacterium]